MAEHVSRVWAPLQFWADQSYWQEWLNIHPGSESLSCVWADQNHSQDLLNTYQGCESLSSVSADWSHWQEWLNTHPACESLSLFEQIRSAHKNGWTCIQRVSPHPVFEQIWTTDKNCQIHPGSESLSIIWSDQNHWQEWLNMHPESEFSSVWADQDHWQEWLNMHLASKSLSSVWGYMYH